MRTTVVLLLFVVLGICAHGSTFTPVSLDVDGHPSSTGLYLSLTSSPEPESVSLEPRLEWPPISLKTGRDREGAFIFCNAGLILCGLLVKLSRVFLICNEEYFWRMVHEY